MSELIFRGTQVNCVVICWWVKAVLFIARGAIYSKIYLCVIDVLPHVWDRMRYHSNQDGPESGQTMKRAREFCIWTT